MESILAGIKKLMVVVSALSLIVQLPPLYAQLSTLQKIQIPSELGEVVSHHMSDRDRLVILIQDAHAIADAQRNIYKLIEYLEKNYNVSLTGLEGADRPLDSTFLRSFPDQPLLMSTFEPYFGRGELSGGTAASILSAQTSNYVGIERWALYEEGLHLFTKALHQEAQLLDSLVIKQGAILKDKKQVYSPELLNVDHALESFYRNESNLVETLLRLAEFLPPPTGGDLETLLADVRSPSKDEAHLRQEVRRAAFQMSGLFETHTELNQMLQQFQTSQISTQAFASFLISFANDHHISLSFSELLKTSLQLELNLRHLTSKSVMADFERYEESVLSALIQSDQERTLVKRSKQLLLLEKMARLEVSPAEWKEFRESRPDLIHGLDFTSHIAFYKNANARDKEMFENLLSLMDRFGKNTATLVAGGFHTAAIADQLREKNISYVMIRPRMSNIPQQSNYRLHMGGEVSWRSYFRIEDGGIDLHAAFIRGVRDQLLSQLAEHINKTHLIHTWRGNLIRSLVKQGKTDVANEYTLFLDEVTQDDKLSERRAFSETVSPASRPSSAMGLVAGATAQPVFTGPANQVLNSVYRISDDSPLASRAETRNTKLTVAEFDAIETLYRHIAVRSKRIPKNHVAVILGNPLPEYPPYFLEAVEQLGSKKTLIVGDGPQGGQWKRIRDELLRLRPQLSSRLYTSEKDKSVSTVTDVGGVIQNLMEHDLKPRHLVLIQRSTAMRVAQRIFEGQWRNQADHLGYQGPAPKFYSYAPERAFDIKAGETPDETAWFYINELVFRVDYLRGLTEVGVAAKKPARIDFPARVLTAERVVLNLLNRSMKRSEARNSDSPNISAEELASIARSLEESPLLTLKRGETTWGDIDQWLTAPPYDQPDFRGDKTKPEQRLDRAREAYANLSFDDLYYWLVGRHYLLDERGLNRPISRTDIYLVNNVLQVAPQVIRALRDPNRTPAYVEVGYRGLQQQSFVRRTAWLLGIDLPDKGTGPSTRSEIRKTETHVSSQSVKEEFFFKTLVAQSAEKGISYSSTQAAKDALYKKSLAELGDSIINDETLYLNTAIFYSPRIADEIFQFIVTAQDAFRLRYGGFSNERFKISLVFDQGTDLSQFRTILARAGRLEGVALYQKEEVRDLTRDLVRDRTFKNHYGVFFPADSLEDQGLDWQRIVRSDIPPEYSILLLPKLSQFFAMTATHNITAAALRRAIPDAFAQGAVSLENFKGISILQPYLRIILAAAKAIGASA